MSDSWKGALISKDWLSLLKVCSNINFGRVMIFLYLSLLPNVIKSNEKWLTKMYSNLFSSYNAAIHSSMIIAVFGPRWLALSQTACNLGLHEVLLDSWLMFEEQLGGPLLNSMLYINTPSGSRGSSFSKPCPGHILYWLQQCANCNRNVICTTLAMPPNCLCHCILYQV